MPLPVISAPNPLMVSRLKWWRIEMKIATAINTPVAETEDTELLVLANNELDDVSGGYICVLPYLVIAAMRAIFKL
jgi:hypothetical protein